MAAFYSSSWRHFTLHHGGILLLIMAALYSSSWRYTDETIEMDKKEASLSEADLSKSSFENTTMSRSCIY